MYFSVGFVGRYLVQLLGMASFGRRTVICNQCHRVKNADRAPNCSCGGRFEPLDNWEWVEGGDSGTGPETDSEESRNV